MKRIVFSDIDGTLLNAQGEIMPLTILAIKSLQEKGIPFVITSARSPSGIYPILREYDFTCPIIAYSGALILDENRQVLYHKGMKKPGVKELINFMEERRLDLSWCIYSLDEWIVKDKHDPRIIHEEMEVKAQSVEGTVDSITNEEIHKILCICAPGKLWEIEKELIAHFPQYSIVKSSDILLEIMENGITKEIAVKKLCTLRGIPLSDAVAFGDNYNDVEMLEAVGSGVLMGNAPEELKKRIPMHTKDNNHEGIYYALKELELL